MYEYGMLRQPEDIKLLVLFAMKSLAQPAQRSEIDEVLSLGETVNYFDLVNVFEELAVSGHIIAVQDEDKLFYDLTALGRETLSQLEKRLPFTIREKAMKNALKVLARIRYDALVYAKLEQQERGCLVTLNINENEDILFELKLMVANKAQADSVIKVFKRDPQRVYQKFIDILTVDINAASQSSKDEDENN